MTADKIANYVSGFGFSFLFTSILSTLLLIAKEENAALKDGMKALSGHHWTTHGILVVALFLILGVVLSRFHLEAKWSENKLIPIILTGAFTGLLVIGGFFLLE